PGLGALVAARTHDRLGGQLRPRAAPPADRDQGGLGDRAARGDDGGRLPLRRDLRRDRALARERPAGRDQPPEPVNELSGKRAVVTGASQGIGSAAAIALARAGANVAFDYRS